MRRVYTNELYHYGVKGMKWGIRKDTDISKSNEEFTDKSKPKSRDIDNRSYSDFYKRNAVRKAFDAKDIRDNKNHTDISKAAHIYLNKVEQGQLFSGPKTLQSNYKVDQDLVKYYQDNYHKFGDKSNNPDIYTDSGYYRSNSALGYQTTFDYYYEEEKLKYTYNKLFEELGETNGEEGDEEEVKKAFDEYKKQCEKYDAAKRNYDAMDQAIKNEDSKSKTQRIAEHIIRQFNKQVSSIKSDASKSLNKARSFVNNLFKK